MEKIQEFILRALPDNRWEVVNDLTYRVEGTIWKVPAGFKTDFASIPKLFWNLYAPWDFAYGPAAILHDFFYQTQGAGVTREYADRAFQGLMKDRGVGFFTRKLFYLAVRTFSGGVWNNYRARALVEQNKAALINVRKRR